MIAILTPLLLTIATQVEAGCYKLCDRDRWKTANVADVQTKSDAGAEVMARDKYGGTPLHHAAGRLFNDEASANIQALIAAGADAKAKSKYGETPWDLAQLNDRLKGTKAYWASNEAQYN